MAEEIVIIDSPVIEVVVTSDETLDLFIDDTAVIEVVIDPYSTVGEVAGGTGAVESVNGKTGVVVLNKADIELGNVDNTSDLDKPISTATQLALDEKQDLLVSGENIKTINGESILGSGNLTIAGSGGGVNPYTSLQFTIQPLL